MIGEKNSEQKFIDARELVGPKKLWLREGNFYCYVGVTENKLIFNFIDSIVL